MQAWYTQLLRGILILWSEQPPFPDIFILLNTCVNSLGIVKPTANVTVDLLGADRARASFCGRRGRNKDSLQALNPVVRTF